jgi:hypothetical protein
LTTLARLLSTIKEASKKYGILYVIKKAIYAWIYLNYYKIFRSKKTFTFRGKKHHYIYHIYNTTWTNERSIEISLAVDLLKKYEGKKILEIGNVISNYFNMPHDVVDKYEKGPNVINEDVVNFQSNEKYDLIVSISTLEHVGWDETPRDDKKIPKAIGNLKKLLNPDSGLLFVTLPIGYNAVLDKLLKDGTMRFHEQYYLHRISKNNEWVEASWANIQDAKFGKPYPGANGLIVGIIHGQDLKNE